MNKTAKRRNIGLYYRIIVHEQLVNEQPMNGIVSQSLCCNSTAPYVSLSVSGPHVLSQHQEAGLSQAGASLVLHAHEGLPLAVETPAGVHLQLGYAATGVGGDKHPRPLPILLVSFG